MRRKPVRYALWSLLVLAPTMIILPSLVMTLVDVPAPLGSDTGPMTATLSIFALMLTALVAPVIVLPEKKDFPLWTAGFVAISFLQLFATLFGYAGGAGGTMAFSVHIPAVVVCLNLFAVILLHAWVASEGMGFSPAVGLATGLAYSLWIIGAGTSQGLNTFLGASSAIFIFAFAASTVTAIIEPAPARTAKDPSGRA